MKIWWKKHPFLSGFALFSLLCLCLFAVFPHFPAFSEWFSRNIASAVRLSLGALSSLVPFSLFEFLIVLFAGYLLFLFGYTLAFFFRKKEMRKAKRLTALFLVVPITLFSVLDIFILSFASSYYRVSTASHLDLATEEVAEDEIFFALECLIDEVNLSAQSLPTNEKGESLSPSLKKIKKEVNLACTQFGEKHSFYQKTGFPAKSFLSSPLMTYTHISGIFGFFTGEANVNTNYPHFIVTASLAHESCHARGIAPENECNFLAAVILMESNNAYLRYCGASFLLDDFLSLCQKIDKERCKRLAETVSPVYFRDMAFYSDFFEPYRESTAAKVADSTNSAYLKSMGQEEGTLSYSRIIRLSAAYFQQNKG